MHSVVGRQRRRKKSRRLGEVVVVRREEYTGLDVEARVELIRACADAAEVDADLELKVVGGHLGQPHRPFFPQQHPHLIGYIQIILIGNIQA